MILLNISRKKEVYLYDRYAGFCLILAKQVIEETKFDFMPILKQRPMVIPSGNEIPLSYGVPNAFAFGGLNAVIAFSRYNA